MNHPTHEISRLRVITRLQAEHQDLLFLFAVYAAHPNTRSRHDLLALIHTMTHSHYTAEIGLFYPVVADLPTGGEILNAAGEGYAKVMSLLDDLKGASSEEPIVRARVRELHAEVQRHIESAEATHGPFVLSGEADIQWDVLERKLTERRLVLDQSHDAWRGT
jgi:hypothetical protein